MPPNNSPQVAEIVTFRLNHGVSDAQYLELNATSHDYVSSRPGFVSRTLSKGADGTWTDYVMWDSLESAQGAQAGFMDQDFASAMIGAIDANTVSMSHQKVLWHPKW